MRFLTFVAAVAVSIGAAAPADDAAAESAIFAGGCFWCVEEAFDKVSGVTETTSGYTGGTVENPTYEQVTQGGTGHFEAVEVEYDPSAVTFETLLDIYWRNVDPFDPRGQFCDKGDSYLSAIFVATDEERQLAERTKEEIAAHFQEPVATQILAEQAFYPAEDYHQNFHETNSARYQYYKFGCGRVQRLGEIWGEDPA